MIRDSFWTDSYIEGLSPDEKLIFVYLLTNPLCNVAGVYEIRVKRIGFETGYDVEVVENILKRFERDKKILRHKDWILIVNHLKNQSLNPSIIQGCQRIFEDLPEEMRRVVTGWVQGGLLYLTLLNLTYISGVPPVSSNNLTNMSFKNQRRYSEEEGYKEPTINADTDELEEDLDVKEVNSKIEERKKIRSNIRTLFKGAKLPQIDAKQVNWHLGYYETLLSRGWSHKQIAHAFINTFTSDVWKEKIQNGEMPGMNTVEFLLRNKDPQRYATN